MSDDAKIAMVRQRWNEFAARYTETANKRMTLQCAKEMHANMALSAAQSVLEVAAGAGLGSLDIVQRMAVGATAKKQFIVTDLSPTMVEMAKETLKNASSEHLDVQVKEANGQDLQDVATSSIDRFISNMCLQLTPDPDAMLREAKRVLKADGFAGFTIWGRPEFSGFFTIDAAMNKELGLSDGADHPNFAMGKDLNALRHKFAAAGFSQVRIWPFLCVLELWNGEEYAKFQEEVSFDVGDEALRARRFEVARRMGDEWLATKGFPIGQETYIIVAKVQQIKKGLRRCSPALSCMFMLQQVEVAGGVECWLIITEHIQHEASVRKKPRQHAGYESPSTKTVSAMGGAKIAMVRQAWSDIAVRFTATANKRMTLQCAEEMHRHLDLGKAFDVLEVGAGAGLGSLDIIKRMAAGATSDTKKKKKQLMVTDLSPTMVKLARETLRNAPFSELIETQVKEANGQDLQDVATGSVDRYISSMCLQITPDPDAMLRETKRILKPDGIAGFTIWGRPEFSGFFTIESLVSREVGFSDGADHPNFAMGKDLNALRHKFAAAGFSHVHIWPFLCVLELWSGEEFAKFNEEMFFYKDEALRARRFKVAERLADEWLATRDVPIGLESYIITAKA